MILFRYFFGFLKLTEDPASIFDWSDEVLCKSLFLLAHSQKHQLNRWDSEVKVIRTILWIHKLIDQVFSHYKVIISIFSDRHHTCRHFLRAVGWPTHYRSRKCAVHNVFIIILPDWKLWKKYLQRVIVVSIMLSRYM